MKAPVIGQRQFATNWRNVGLALAAGAVNDLSYTVTVPSLLTHVSGYCNGSTVMFLVYYSTAATSLNFLCGITVVGATGVGSSFFRIFLAPGTYVFRAYNSGALAANYSGTVTIEVPGSLASPDQLLNRNK